MHRHVTRLFFAAAFLAVVAAMAAPAARAAMYEGRNIDGHWYEGRAVSTTYGAYRCQIKFNGDRAFFKLDGSSIQIVGMLDEEVITDPHDILVRDPKRGVNWTLEVVNLPH
ncbi:MAG: hypothetical protein KAY61_05230 [Candidatus Eisenbacteria bacterium]|jgi:hypothetical protein|nr:hypothetical protein [Candidatus Eisenbacteria bacterium]